jgi:hypothetical protein
LDNTFIQVVKRLLITVLASLAKQITPLQAWFVSIVHVIKAMEENATLCLTAEYLSENIQLKVMLAIRIFISILAIIFLIALFKAQGTYLAFHANARILLVSHNIWAILSSLGNLLPNTFDLVNHSLNYHQDPCRYLFTTTVSVLIRGLLAITLFGLPWALAAIAIERCFATFNFRTYESSSSAIGISLVAAQVRKTRMTAFFACVIVAKTTVIVLFPYASDQLRLINQFLASHNEFPRNTGHD